MSIQETLATRRQFLQYSALGLASVVVGAGASFSRFPRSGVQAQTTGIHLGMTTVDAEMVDGLLVPHWVYTLDGRPGLPGPAIFAYEQDELQISITNQIPGAARRFAIVGNDFAGNPFSLVRQSEEIAFGATGVLTIPAGGLAPGTYLYKDPTFDPVSRVLGLHGVLIILPNPAVTQTNPYGSFSTPNVTALFAALGQGTPRDPNASFPGQPWFATTEANPAGYQPQTNDSDRHHRWHFVEAPHSPESLVFERFLYRSRIWLHTSIDPELNRQVIGQGNIPDPATVKANFLPQYFSINGRQGAFAMHAADVFPRGTVGEPHLIRLLNAGLASHSPHQHGNHAYLVALNNVVGGGGAYFGNAAGADNVFWIDTINLEPEDRVDWVLPFIRPPDIPKVVGSDGLLTPLAQLIAQELDTVLIVSQNPLGYPMHSHMELDQTAAGGNYPQGAVTQLEMTGEFGADFKPHVHPPPPPVPVPVAVNDSATTSGNTPVIIPVLANDTVNGQPIPPADAIVALTMPPGVGVALLNSDKTFTYTANPGFAGTDHFTYTVTVKGQLSNPAAVTIMVMAVLNLKIDRFRVKERVRLARRERVEIQLRVRNEGGSDGAAPATVVGVQNGVQIYNQTLTVSDARGGGATSFTLAPYTPTVAGRITWTVTLLGATATAITEVR